MALSNTDAVLHQAFPEGGYDIISTPHDGISGYRVVLVQTADGDIQAVKYGRAKADDIATLRKQMENRQLLVPHLGAHLPEVRQYKAHPGSGSEFMVMDCPVRETIYDAVVQSLLTDEECLRVWDQILASFVAMWSGSKSKFSLNDAHGGNLSRYPRQRARRIEQGLNSQVFEGIPFADIRALPVQVNGERCISVDDIFAAGDDLTHPTMVVICHADPNPFNFLARRSGDWWIVDWEWVSLYCDWRLSLSEFISWWFVYASHQRTEPRCVVEDGVLKLGYQHRIASVCVEMAHRAWQAGEQFAADAHDEHAMKVVQWHVAARLMSEIRFLRMRGRPAALMLPLLGEAVRVQTFGVPAWLEGYRSRR